MKDETKQTISIKPKWYEDKSNFPAVVINIKNGKIITVLCPDDWFLAENSNFRLAAKQERDSLYYEGK